MSTEIDEGFIRDTYRKMSDQELVVYLTQHSAGLTPEAMKIVREEVALRNLDGDGKDIATPQRHDDRAGDELFSFYKL